MLYGIDTSLPRRRYFDEISHGHHHHTNCLGEFVVHLIRLGNELGIQTRHFARENSLKLEANGFTLFPDCAFQLVTSEGRQFNFVVELDNGTERVRTRQDVESIERKLRGYDAHQSQFAADDPRRYLVLFVTTRTERRLRHILELADSIMANRQRTVFIGIGLTRMLQSRSLWLPIYEDHRGLKRTLIPRPAESVIARI